MIFITSNNFTSVEFSGSNLNWVMLTYVPGILLFGSDECLEGQFLNEGQLEPNKTLTIIELI